jgi:hypothetical protein
MKRLIFLYFSVLGLVACGTHQIKTGEGRQAGKLTQWESKAVIRDLRKNESHTVDIDILANAPTQLRLEISALMGMQVASLVLNQDDLRYVIYSQKRFFQGRASESSFLPLMNVPLHPRNFLNLITDVPLKGPGWQCKNGGDGLVSECVQSTRELKVTWQDRTPEGQKKVLISGPKFEMRWLFRPPQTEVQFKPETFRLEPPADFKTVQLK